MFKTHLAFGVLVALLAVKFLIDAKKELFFVIVVLSAIMPDIDAPFSKISQKIKPLSWMLSLFVGHRGVLHTIYFPLLVYFLLRIFEQDVIAGAFFLGYISHLIIDMLTVNGVHFFYPINKVQIRGFIKSGGILEWILFVLILTAIGFLIFKY